MKSSKRVRNTRQVFQELFLVQKNKKKKWDSGERDSEAQVACVYTHVHDYAQTHTHCMCWIKDNIKARIWFKQM